MRAGTAAFAVVAVGVLGACGSIKSSHIYGIPSSVPDGTTPVLQEVQVGERPYYSAVISRGSIDSITNLSLELRVGSGPTMTVPRNELDCTQISSQNRSCSYVLQGPAPPGATVKSTWRAWFRWANLDSDATSVGLPGTLVPHDLDWEMVLIISFEGATPQVIPLTGSVFVLESDHDYTISATMKNNAGPVVPVLAEARVEFDDPNLPPIVIPYVNTSGLQTDELVGPPFAFTTPITTTDTDGTITMSFIGNNDDAVPANDVVNLNVRITP